VKSFEKNVDDDGGVVMSAVEGGVESW